jgi:hypothetical protein
VSDLVTRAAELIEAIVKERVADEASDLRAQLNAVMEERGEARRDRDRAMHERDCARMERDEVRAHSLRRFTSIREALGAPMEELADDAARRVVAERDAARAEIGVMAARCTELEARLAQRLEELAVASAVAKPAEGFRVGDLVECDEDEGHYAEIIDVSLIALRSHPYNIYTRPHSASSLTRKPVKEGDMVRDIHVNRRGEVRAIAKDGFASVINADTTADNFSAPVAHLVAVSP